MPSDIPKPEPKVRNVRTLYQVWWGYIRPLGSTEIQRVEMERAFYSGFATAMNTMQQIAENLSEDVATKELDKIHQEIQTYFEELKKSGNQSKPR